MAPVRLGLAKPLGASSVCAEYQMSSSRATAYYSGRLLDRGSPEAPNALPSFSLPHIRASSSYLARESPLFTLPAGGIRLQPQGGLAEAQSFPPDVIDDDRSEETWPTASQGTEDNVSFSAEVRVVPPCTGHLTPSLSLNDWECLIDEEMMVVETSDSDSEAEAIQLQDILHAGRQAAGGEGVEEENRGLVYQYAWALDGRTLGEVFRGPSSTMELVSTCNIAYEIIVFVCSGGQADIRLYVPVFLLAFLMFNLVYLYECAVFNSTVIVMQWNVTLNGRWVRHNYTVYTPNKLYFCASACPSNTAFSPAVCSF